MKQKILSLILLATLIVSCDNKYSEKNNSVYYELPPMFPRDLHFSPPKILVKFANAASFEELKKGYGKDKNHVFYKGYLIKNADPATFKIIDYVIDDFDKNKPYSKDNNSVFNGGSEIPGANPKTFQILLKVPYLKDDKDYYIELTLFTTLFVSCRVVKK